MTTQPLSMPAAEFWSCDRRILDQVDWFWSRVIGGQEVVIGVRWKPEMVDCPCCKGNGCIVCHELGLVKADNLRRARDLPMHECIGCGEITTSIATGRVGSMTGAMCEECIWAGDAENGPPQSED